MPDAPQRSGTMQWIGFVLGPLLAVAALYLLPQQFHAVAAEGPDRLLDFSWPGRATLAVMLWMGIWWLTEAVHISVTALLPIVLFPLLGATTAKEACFPYSDPLVFLYFGGFIIALSMQRWGLGRRIALLTLGVVGTSATGMVAGFMLVTAVLSAFVSNTATTAMMLPIALSVIGLLRQSDRDETRDPQSPDLQAGRDRVGPFSVCLLLSIAYSASVGGVMTIIGTPTNAFLVGFLRDKIAPEYRQDFSFFSWLPIGVSFAVVMLPIIYLVLTRFAFPIKGITMAGGAQLVKKELDKLGPVKRGEWNTLVVFCVTVLLWFVRPLLTRLEIPFGDIVYRPLANLSDPVIAMLGASLLFVIPVEVKNRVFTMDWEHASKMPWGILFLFGGGLSLAAAMQANGVAEFIGSQAGVFAVLPAVVIVLIVSIAIVFLTELTSNAATTASLVPVLAALAPGLGVHPYLLIFPATVAASCAFMLPVATPPNAIVFGSGEITIPQMARTGIYLNLIAVVLVTALAFYVVKPWLGV
ncbi:SLC13 family permease [Novipirellula artificiosorum]|uniref:Sodium-dependent dicarboxylate transporter SdcS n=1 Tax=Novipirellula artificiosorum TaxID=2528016 RepID=A0A5C6E0W3_9BACT|nr:SLC13 family permease [Novipirellula artificiosorum]TWU42522.1 Sodium-dependent dicarboxylate transporter SdcS [Novipirellula artificiosorum]